MSYEQDICNPEPEFLNNNDCHPHSVVCVPVDPCARFKARVQTLEIELDRKNRCLEEEYQKNRRLLSIKRELEHENNFTKEELAKLRKKFNVVEVERDLYKRRRVKLRDLLDREQEKTEKLNEKNKELKEKMEAAKKVTTTTTTTSSDSSSSNDSKKDDASKKA